MADGKTGVSAPAAAARGSGGGGLSARQVQIRSLVQALGMLPVLIILAIAFHYLGEERFSDRAEPLDRRAAGVDQHRARAPA